MPKYRSGTMNALDVNERRRARLQRTLASANRPTGSQAFGTTEKVRALDADMTEAKEMAKTADEKASKALAAAMAGLPPGSVVQMSSETSPADAGAPGTWELLTVSHIPMTGISLYLYERTK